MLRLWLTKKMKSLFLYLNDSISCCSLKSTQFPFSSRLFSKLQHSKRILGSKILPVFMQSIRHVSACLNSSYWIKTRALCKSSFCFKMSIGIAKAPSRMFSSPEFCSVMINSGFFLWMVLRRIDFCYSLDCRLSKHWGASEICSNTLLPDVLLKSYSSSCITSLSISISAFFR